MIASVVAAAPTKTHWQSVKVHCSSTKSAVPPISSVQVTKLQLLNWSPSRRTARLLMFSPTCFIGVSFLSSLLVSPKSVPPAFRPGAHRQTPADSGLSVEAYGNRHLRRLGLLDRHAALQCP